MIPSRPFSFLKGTPVALDAIQIRFLRGLAHDLNPVVMIGNKGMSDGVRMELDEALTRHDLVKIRVIADDREARDEVVKALVRDTKSELIQKVGHTATFYRRSDKPKILFPGEKPARREDGAGARDGQRAFRTKREDVSRNFGDRPRSDRSAGADTRPPRREGGKYAGAPARAAGAGFTKRPPRRDEGAAAGPSRERTFGGRADGPTHRTRPVRDFGDRPARDAGDRPKRPYADRPARPAGAFADRPKRDFGDRPARPAREAGDRPRPVYGDRPARPARVAGERSARPPTRDFGDRPKPAFGDRPARAARPAGNFADRPKRDFGDRPARPAGPKRDFGDRPKPAFGDRPARAARPAGAATDRPKRDFGDRPARSPGAKPAYKSAGGAYKPSARPSTRKPAGNGASPYKPLGAKGPKRERDED